MGECTQNIYDDDRHTVNPDLTYLMNYLLECMQNIYDDGYTVTHMLKYVMKYQQENIDDSQLHVFVSIFDNNIVVEAIYTYEYSNV